MTATETSAVTAVVATICPQFTPGGSAGRARAGGFRFIAGFGASRVLKMRRTLSLGMACGAKHASASRIHQPRFLCEKSVEEKEK